MRVTRKLGSRATELFVTGARQGEFFLPQRIRASSASQLRCERGRRASLGSSQREVSFRDRDTFIHTYHVIIIAWVLLTQVDSVIQHCALPFPGGSAQGCS